MFCSAIFIELIEENRVRTCSLDEYQACLLINCIGIVHNLSGIEHFLGC